MAIRRFSSNDVERVSGGDGASVGFDIIDNTLTKDANGNITEVFVDFIDSDSADDKRARNDFYVFLSSYSGDEGRNVLREYGLRPGKDTPKYKDDIMCGSTWRVPISLVNEYLEGKWFK